MRAAFLLAAAYLVAGGRDVIDRRIAERWEAEGIRSAGPADDYEFLRRLSLDLRGVIPQPDEIRAFASDPDPARREKIVDGWLRSEDFVRAWGRRWTEDLSIDATVKAKYRPLHDAFEGWVRDAIRSNMPYDRFVKRMLTAKGPVDLDPAAGFLMAGLGQGPEGAKDVTERASRLFLGMQVRCAECHDHPFDDWTQQDFYGMAAFFWQSRAETQTKSSSDLSGKIVEDPSKGEPSPPGEGSKGKKGEESAAPKAISGPRYKPTGEGPGANEARRPALARLMVSDPQFARAAVNRHWGMLVGRGLVHPLDGFTVARKPSHPELLDELASEFARGGFDVRHLMKSILLSRPYQLSSRLDAAGPTADRLFARAITAPLSPEQLYESLCRATGFKDQTIQTRVKTDPRTLREAFMREFQPAVSPADPSPASPEATISQALFFLNGEITNGAVSQAIRARVGKTLERDPEPPKRLEHLFLSALCRPPTAREAALLLERLGRRDHVPEAYEDVLWALINSTEFVTRH